MLQWYVGVFLEFGLNLWSMYIGKCSIHEGFGIDSSHALKNDGMDLKIQD